MPYSCFCLPSYWERRKKIGKDSFFYPIIVFLADFGKSQAALGNLLWLGQLKGVLYFVRGLTWIWSTPSARHCSEREFRKNFIKFLSSQVQSTFVIKMMREKNSYYNLGWNCIVSICRFGKERLHILHIFLKYILNN